MILTIDVGNTYTVLGGFEGDALIFTARLSTDRFGTEDEFAGKILSALTVHRIVPEAVSGVIFSSVVPSPSVWGSASPSSAFSSSILMRMWRISTV